MELELDISLLPNIIIKLRFLLENEINLSHMPAISRLIVDCSTKVSPVLYIIEILVVKFISCVPIVASRFLMFPPSCVLINWFYMLVFLCHFPAYTSREGPF